MLHKSIRLIACICLAALLLAGCNTQEAAGPGAIGSQVWQAPALTYGVLETEPLAILPWNSGRCEDTSRYILAETQDGYYSLITSQLCYAQKTDLSTWLPVCNKPDCKHGGADDCSSKMTSSAIVIKDDRIFFQTAASQYPHLCPYEGSGYILLSMAPDGSDIQLAYAIEEDPNASKGMYVGLLTPRNWIYYREYLDKGGNMVRKFYRTTDAGTQVIPTNSNGLGESISTYMSRTRYGDEGFLCNVLGTSEYGLFRFVDGKLIETEYAGLEAYAEGGYLSGNTLRIFRPNDGYYDVDLTTREEIFLAPAQLENSSASVILPNCIIESTLCGNGILRNELHELKVFDGQSWRSVQLPEELANSGINYKFMYNWVTSDSIFFVINNPKTGIADYYRIPLGTDTLVAEFCAKFD